MPELDLTPEPAGAPQTGAEAPLPAHIDHYDILGRLGQGGMGEVYLARDRRLGRQVALKMLAGRYNEDAGLRQRFLSEARAVSALEHPHICRLYDVGEWQGRPYFTMERLRGETLRDRLRTGALPLDEVRRIGAQVAAALAVAHEHGILHCDVKPSNLFLTTDSGAKVVDFGIARRLQAAASLHKPGGDDSTVSGTLDQGNSPAGTPFYMSPEQVRGEELDARADQFSLGAVLYEMASGQQPFRAPSVVEIYALILREPAAPLALDDQALADAVARTLAKDRGQRFASLSELAAVLRSKVVPPCPPANAVTDAQAAPAAAPTQPPPPAAVAQPPAPRSPWVLVLGAAVLAVAAAGAFVAWRPAVNFDPPVVTPLVSSAGDKDAPAVSPDGKRVAFAWTNEQGNNVDIYVKTVGGGPPLRLTENPLTDTDPVWSPDGKQLAFVRTGAAGVDTENGYYVVDAGGGEARKIAPSTAVPNLNGGSNIAWRPDGKALVYCDRRSREAMPAMFSVELATNAISTILEGKGYFANPVFSPDGKLLAYTRGPSFISHDIYVMNVATGESRQLTHDLHSIAGVSWEPTGAGLIFSSNRVGLFSLWRIGARGGEPQRLTVGGSDALSPTVARAGNGRLSYLSRRVNINLWRYPLDGSGGPPERLVSSTRISTEPDYSPDGTRIAFASERSGSWEIWTARDDGSEPVQLTNTPGQQSASPRWSPDGRSVIYDTRYDGHADLALIEATAGARPQRLTADPSDEFLPRFSRDGKWIYFFSNRGGSTQLWRMPAPGQPEGAPVQLTLNGLSDAVESEDRKFLYISRRNKLWRLPIDARVEEGIEEALPKMFWRDFALVPGGVIYATGWTNLIQTVEQLDWRTGVKRKLMEIGPRPNLFGPFVVSPDRKWLLTDRVDQHNVEIMMVENFR